MWWRKTEKPIRRQLIEARARLQRQIEIMSVGPIRLAYQSGSKEQLEQELRQIDEALASLGPSDA